MTELTQQRLMMAGFRLLRTESAGGRFLIRYRDRGLFEAYGGDSWRTLASYATLAEQDEALEALLESDFWSVEV